MPRFQGRVAQMKNHRVAGVTDPGYKRGTPVFFAAVAGFGEAGGWGNTPTRLEKEEVSVPILGTHSGCSKLRFVLEHRNFRKSNVDGAWANARDDDLHPRDGFLWEVQAEGRQAVVR